MLSISFVCTVCIIYIHYFVYSSGPVDTHSEPVFSSQTFEELNCLHPHLLNCLTKKMGFQNATEIQVKTILNMLKGEDVLVKAQTGSGTFYKHLN